MQVRCPNCRTTLPVEDDSSLSSIVCASCGSDFSLVTDETVISDASHDEQLGSFELQEQLGVGAFGAVFRAYDKELDRTVAIKIPRKGQLDDTETEKFVREARAAAQLNHPNVVSIHEVGREGETLYIVSDFVEEYGFVVYNFEIGCF